MGLTLPNKQLGSKIVKPAGNKQLSDRFRQALERFKLNNPQKPLLHTAITNGLKPMPTPRNYFYDPKQPWLK